MNKSDSIKNLSVALCKVSDEIKNPNNTANNPFFKSKYAPLDDILNLARPLLSKNGLSLIQSPITDSDKVGVSALLLHTSGEFIEFEPFYFTTKNTAQDAGSAITYARRYQVNAILGICGEDDDDGNHATGNKPEPKKEEKQKETEPPKTTPKNFFCKVCQKQITATSKSTPAQVAEKTKERTGEERCSDCFVKWQDAEKKKLNDIANGDA